MIKKFLNRKIPTPIAIGIIIVLVALVGGYTWWQFAEIRKDEADIPNIVLPDKKEVGADACFVDEDCVVFGEDGDCNCGCFNKNYDWKPAGALCFFLVPTSCKCVDSRCKEIYRDETAEWEIYENEEWGFEMKYPENWSITESHDTLIVLINNSKPSQQISILKSSGPPPETFGVQTVESKTVVVDNITATKEIMQGRFNNKDYYYLRVFIREKQMFYDAYCDKDGFDKDSFEEFSLIYDRILSTFKFLE